MTNWIKCSTALPEPGKRVAIIGNGGFGEFYAVALCAKGWFYEFGCDEPHDDMNACVWAVSEIAYWCELPEVPHD